MADERYPWLDLEAAERLLRGEPVEPFGVDARSQDEARRLAAALDAARLPEAANDPMPLRGEEEALAAFRKVRDGGADELLPTAVRLGGVESGACVTSVASVGAVSRRRRGRWGRPVRWGLAASLAGFAVGGVAVAAGVGALPGPFGDEHTPVPESTVSAPVSPEPEESGSVTAGADTSPPDGPTPGEGGAVIPSAPGGEEPTGGADGGGTASPDDRGRGDKKGGDPSWGWGNDGGSRSEWYAETLDACRDYRSGQLDDESKRQLESLAKGADRVTHFCDRVLDAGTGDSGNGNSGSDSSGSGSADGDSDGDGRGGNDDRGGDSGKGWIDGGVTQGAHSLTAVPEIALSLSAEISVF
ncbi:hypothetical protein V1460_05020 [Streptomyces sp. SCSIO 30461]|uniref:hypothetical protein n=1 Tax=Streptomyces sp. SCSIO 30461 TaxID=3118085 RepID=UPI0030D2430E